MDFVNSSPPDYLLSSNQLNSPENLSLFNAAMLGSSTGVENALRKGAKVNFFNNPEDQKTALHIACENGFSNIVEVLIKNGAVVDLPTGTTKSTALMLGVQSGSTPTVEILIKENANVNSGKLNSERIV